jgi:hypothetical protein
MHKTLLFLAVLIVSAVCANAQQTDELVGANGEKVVIDKGWTYLAHNEHPKGKVWEIWLYQPDVFRKRVDGTLVLYLRNKMYAPENKKISYVLDAMEVRCRSRQWRKVLEWAIYVDGTNERTIGPTDETIFTTPDVGSLGDTMLTKICKIDQRP